MVNRGGIGDLLVGRKMAGLPTVQDVQTYAHGGETTIEMPHSLKELQNWNKTHPDKNLMDKIFTDRKVGVEGADPIAMPANVDELTAFMKAKREGYAHGGEISAPRKGYADGGETDSDESDAATRDAIYGGDNTRSPSFRAAEIESMAAYDRAERAAERDSIRRGDTVGSDSSSSFFDRNAGRDASSYSGPVSRFGTDVTNANITAGQPSNVSPSGNFDIYGGMSGSGTLISPGAAPSFRAADFSTNPFVGPYVSPAMTVARMQDNPVSSNFNQKAMESLDPWFQSKAAGLLNRMMDTGLTPYFSSGSRTVAQQKGLYDNPSPYGAAPPGMSAHNFGQAFDIGGLTNKQMIDAGLMAESEGLGWGGRFKTYDPVHIQEMPSSASPAQYAASVGVSPFTGTSVGGVETSMAAPRPEPFDVGKAITDRISETFTPGGIGSLVLGAAVPPVGLYDLAANVVNMAGGNMPTTSRMINNGLGISSPEAPQAPVIPALQPSHPISPTPTGSTDNVFANVSTGPTTRGVGSRMQVADASNTVAPSESAPAAPQEQNWWDRTFNNAQTVQDLLSKPNSYNPGYANTTSGLTKEEWAAQMQVDPETVKARITTMNGEPQVDWYTKGLDEALGEMLTGPFNAIKNLFGSGKNNAAAPATETAPYIPTGGIGDHQNLIARNMLKTPTEDPTTPRVDPMLYQI